MKGLVRGAILVSVLSVLAVYAQIPTENGLVMAEGMNAQAVAQTNVDNNNFLAENFNTQAIDASLTPGGDDDDKDTKLVKKTGMVTASGMGSSKGAFSASAYCFSGRTAMGHGVRRGLIAADPRVLPMGSKVFIDAGAWSGVYLVSDTGGAIKGKRIDIWVPSCGEATRFGRRSVQVYAAK